MNNSPDLDRLKAILFDFDGVVVQSEDVYDRATKKLGEMYGVQIPVLFYEANRGISEALFYERFKTEFDLDVDLASLHENGQKLLWAEFSSSVHYTPGFQQFYTKIRKHVGQAALVTATPRPLVNEIFKNSNIDVDFDFIVTSSDVENTKPAPESYLKACGLIGVEPFQALVIEDSSTGLRAATAAGCQTIGITTSCSKDSLKEANFIVDSFGELEELLTIV